MTILGSEMDDGLAIFISLQRPKNCQSIYVAISSCIEYMGHYVT
jgi:hypothetical protein